MCVCVCGGGGGGGGEGGTHASVSVHADIFESPNCIQCKRWQSPSPSHLRAADEAWYWLKMHPVQWVTLHKI